MQQRDNRIVRQRHADGRRREQQHRDGPSRGNARQKYENYMARARAAQLAGDVVEMENCYQHAEHYWRVMRAAESAPYRAPGRTSDEQRRHERS
jgi:Domain of unknown function (DUF4167)